MGAIPKAILQLKQARVDAVIERDRICRIYEVVRGVAGKAAEKADDVKDRISNGLCHDEIDPVAIWPLHAQWVSLHAYAKRLSGIKQDWYEKVSASQNAASAADKALQQAVITELDLSFMR